MATTVTLKPNAIDISGSTSGTTTLQATAVAGTTTITLPAATDTLVGKATTDTLTNKTLVAPALGTPVSGVVTNLTGTASININGTVGATTASTGAFTTLSATGVTTVQAGTAAAPAITTSGDTNTGIFFPAADTIAFTEGGAEAMRIDSSGNVGIGTASPSAKLDVRTAALGTALQLTDDTNYGANFIGVSGGLKLAMNGSQTFAIFQSTNERLRIDSSGNVLVGTTSNIAANAKLFALGNGVGIAVGYGTGSSEYRHLYMNSGDGTLYFFNNTNYASLSAAGAWTNASDARLKKNIVDIKYGLADVLKTKPRSYQMNDVAGDFVGFVAQELQTVISEVVSGDPEKQLGVDYGSLVAVAFKAIQEQQALITSLTARIAALEST